MTLVQTPQTHGPHKGSMRPPNNRFSKQKQLWFLDFLTTFSDLFIIFYKHFWLIFLIVIPKIEQDLSLGLMRPAVPFFGLMRPADS
jgi:hypothetical protein